MLSAPSAHCALSGASSLYASSTLSAPYALPSHCVPSVLFAYSVTGTHFWSSAVSASIFLPDACASSVGSTLTYFVPLYPSAFCAHSASFAPSVPCAHSSSSILSTSTSLVVHMPLRQKLGGDGWWDCERHGDAPSLPLG